MEITLSKILRIAELSKLKFNEEEAKKFTGELDKIIDYINKIQKLDMSNKEIELKTTHNLKPREDEVVKGLPTSEALAGAPMVSGNYLVVPKLI